MSERDTKQGRYCYESWRDVGGDAAIVEVKLYPLVGETDEENDARAKRVMDRMLAAFEPIEETK